MRRKTEECNTWSSCCSRCTQHSWLSRVVKRMTLSPTRGRIRWRHGGDCGSDMIRRQEEGNVTFCARSFLLDGALFWNSKGIERWESYVSRCEKKMKDKLDDEIKLAGLESLVPELEKHLILNSNRLRTFEDARLEVVTHVEAKFGLRIRDSKPSDTGASGHSDPMDVDAVNFVKGKRSSSPRDGCSKCGGTHVQQNCNARKSTGKQSSGKGKQSSHSPRVRAKAGVERTRENPKENPKEPKVPKAHTRAKHRTLVSQVLKTRNRRQAQTLRNLHRHVPPTLPGTMVGMVTNGSMAGVLMNGMMTGLWFWFWLH